MNPNKLQQVSQNWVKHRILTTPPLNQNYSNFSRGSPKQSPSRLSPAQAGSARLRFQRGNGNSWSAFWGSRYACNDFRRVGGTATRLIRSISLSRLLRILAEPVMQLGLLDVIARRRRRVWRAAARARARARDDARPGGGIETYHGPGSGRKLGGCFET
jgi:hypothetical protein